MGTVRRSASDGFPLGYEVVAGNTHDSKTVKTIIESLEKKHGSLNRVWVMDREMVSEENLKFLRERGGKYIVGTPKQRLRDFEKQLTEQGWTTAQAGVDVKLIPGPDGDETFLLARSADRRAKEQAMHSKFADRMETGLKKMQAAAVAGRLNDETKAGERLGRLKQTNWRASHAFDITVKKLDAPQRQATSGNHLAAQCTVRRLVTIGRWLRLASQQSDGCRRGHTVASLHPVGGSRMGLPHRQGRTRHPPHLASKERP